MRDLHSIWPQRDIRKWYEIRMSENDPGFIFKAFRRRVNSVTDYVDPLKKLLRGMFGNILAMSTSDDVITFGKLI